jgi:hypothetical protein
VARTLDEDPAHGEGCGGEKVSAAVPFRGVLAADEPEVRLVDEGGGLEGLPGAFFGELGGGEVAEFLIHQGQEIPGGLAIATLDGLEKPGDVGRVLFPGRHVRTLRFEVL